MSDPTPSPTERIETPTVDPAASAAAASAAAAVPTAPTAPTTGQPSSPPPDWAPPKEHHGGRNASLVLGLILLASGLWFFADQTLGLDMPTIRWSQLWPLILIVIGGWILVGAMRRRSR